MKCERVILRTAAIVITIICLTAEASAASWITGMKSLAYALAYLMIVIMGIMWIMADSANERSDAKKGIMYILVGILVVASACQIMNLYCNSMGAAGVAADCSDLSSVGC